MPHNSSNQPTKAICLLDEAIKLRDEHIADLSQHFEILPWQSSDPRTRALAQVFLLHSQLDANDLAALSACRYFGVRAHNTDYVPRAFRTPRFVVRGIPQFGTESTAEHTLAMIFSLSKNLRQSHQQTVDGLWRTGLPLNIRLTGKTLGIVGYGKIGQSVAQMARAFGLEIVVAAKSIEAHSATRRPLHEVLSCSDIISVHASTRDNAPVLDRAALQLLRPNAILINTARGSLIDYEALGDMVRAGRLLGVGLDVYPTEPPSLDWLNHPRVLCSPHVAYATDSTLAAMDQALISQSIEWWINESILAPTGASNCATNL